MKKKKWKIESFKPFIADTILSGNWSREAKFHTVENLVRAFSVLMLVSPNFNILWKIIPALTVGFTIRKQDKEHYQLNLW